MAVKEKPMIRVWLSHDESLRYQAMTLRASRSMLLVLKHYNDLTETDTPAPAVTIDPKLTEQKISGKFTPPDKLRLGENDPKTELDTIAHEMAHYTRYKILGKLEPKEGLTMEEACAIYAETSFLFKEEKDPKQKIIKHLNDSYFKKDELGGATQSGVLEMAKRIIQNFETRSMPAQDNVLSLSNNLGHMRKAIAQAETERRESTKNDLEPYPPEYSVGAGVALLLFIINNSNQERGIKRALTDRIDQIQTYLAVALVQDTGGRIKREINQLMRLNSS